ncbi:MAG: hypothetical protein AAGA30_05900, partial [Planctomycetota bacterium]
YVAWIPTVACSISTLIAIPICCIGRIQLESMAGIDINNSAVIAYFFIVAVLALPCAIFTALVFAPLLHKITLSNINQLNGINSTLMLVFVWIIFDQYFPTVMNSLFPKFDGWLVCYNLVSFLGLPIIVGTFCFVISASFWLSQTKVS